MTTTKKYGLTFTGEDGPLYSVPLIDDLPLGTGEVKEGCVAMRQAMPGRSDLIECRKKMKLDRVVAGYEVLLYRFTLLNAACLRFVNSKDLSVEESDAVEDIRKAVVQ